MIFKKKANKPPASDTFLARPETEPVNLPLLELVKTYKANLPLVLKPKVEKAREFFLNEIVPTVLAVSNGMQDGVDVARGALEDEPDASAYVNAMNQMVSTALRVKMANFTRQVCNLNQQESEVFLDLIFRPPKDDVGKASEIIRRLADTPEELHSTNKMTFVRPGIVDELSGRNAPVNLALHTAFVRGKYPKSPDSQDESYPAITFYCPTGRYEKWLFIRIEDRDSVYSSLVDNYTAKLI
jgi:hypothetical protein